MRGTINWSDADGFWTVTDEYGDIWTVVEVDGRHGLLVREDSQRYYGAEWCADAGGSDAGEVMPRRTGDTYDGLETVYEFDELAGWGERVAP